MYWRTARGTAGGSAFDFENRTLQSLCNDPKFLKISALSKNIISSTFPLARCACNCLNCSSINSTSYDLDPLPQPSLRVVARPPASARASSSASSRSSSNAASSNASYDVASRIRAKISFRLRPCRRRAAVAAVPSPRAARYPVLVTATATATHATTRAYISYSCLIHLPRPARTYAPYGVRDGVARAAVPVSISIGDDVFTLRAVCATARATSRATDAA